VGEPRSRWLPIAGFALASSANQMAWLVFAPLTTGAAAHFRVSDSQVGLLSEVFPLMYVLLALPAARLVDRSLRFWLGAGAVLNAFGAVLRLGGLNRDGFAWVLLGQIVVAASQPLLLNAVTALARRYLRPEDRPAGIAVGSAGTFLGFVLAFVAAATLGATRSGLLLTIGAAYSGVGALVLVVALARWSFPYPSEGVTVAAGWGEMRRLWSDPVMRGLVSFVFVGFGVFVSLTTWAQPLLQPAGVDARQSDTLLTFMVLGGVASSALVPPWVARRGWQLPALLVGGAVTIVACSVLAWVPGLMSATVSLCLVGVLLLPCLPVMLEVAERRGGEGAAATAGLLWLAGQAGGIVVAVLSGFAEGTPWLAFATLAAVLALAAPMARRLRGQLSALGATGGEAP
jgi:predicted MFS family arabinose efflux permease